MPKTEPFDRHLERYEHWFERHAGEYDAELQAVRALMPPDPGRMLEVGVGSGRFAAPLGVGFGVEPSAVMARRARDLGVTVAQGIGEALPFVDATFGGVLLVTTLCFVDDLDRTCREAFRVLQPGGCILTGFVDLDSDLGRRYDAHKAESVFYRDARFYTTAQVLAHLSAAGFVEPVLRQTLIPGAPAGTVAEGHGRGAFVVIRAERPGAAERV
ncbi:class I SAM-dependent methyltransferase [Ectothiorhodospira mobilis]|uniref:class I SAM-dependent methyltransferase n=1 Tax=Ectothiorhodospira mobilis TaxID=195064 RepID=UPI001EE83AC2|nr:class I SAM-dependent methyltransferase [Ectothiorhodospira mobilis]MCG5535583.1 class I SAM-dependent methyltransferase [Ectothiorhodospira mobilis]